MKFPSHGFGAARIYNLVFLYVKIFLSAPRRSRGAEKLKTKYCRLIQHIDFIFFICYDLDIMNWLLILLIISSILLITLILLQKANNDGTGALGGDSFLSKNKKRGLEKTIFQFTIIISIVFVILNLVAVFVK